MPSRQRSLRTNVTAPLGQRRAPAGRWRPAPRRWRRARRRSPPRSPTRRPCGPRYGASSLWPSPPEAVKRDPPPAASTMAAVVTAQGLRWIGPSVSRSGRASARPVRWAMISAQIDTAVSSGVRAPRSSPIGARMRASAGLVDPRLAQPRDAVGVGAPAAHGAEVADLGGERGHDGGDVELGVVGEHAHRVARGRASRRPGRAAGRASRPRPRRPAGTGPGWRTPRGRRTRSPGSRAPWPPGPARR